MKDINWRDMSDDLYTRLDPLQEVLVETDISIRVCRTKYISSTYPYRISVFNENCKHWAILNKPNE